MRRAAWLLVALIGGAVMAGCATGEVKSEDVESWQEQGRDPNDTSQRDATPSQDDR